MKKIYLLFTLCFTFIFSNAQDIVNIPDPVFKNLLLYGVTNNYSDYFSGGDTNGDGELQITEAEAITNILLESSVFNGSVYNLTGIESLVNLVEFSIDGIFKGSSINLSQNTALQTLVLSECELVSIDLSQNINLSTLHLTNALLEEIDLSVNTELEYLILSDNKLTDIVFPSSSPEIKDLDIANNELTTLDFRSLGVINDGDTLMLQNNKLSSILFNDYQIHGYINLSNNLFTSLDTSKMSIQQILINNNYHLEHLNLIRDETMNDMELISANACPNLSVVCVNHVNSPPNVQADQSSNINYIKDCSTITGNYNQIVGTVAFDYANDGCNANITGMDGVLIETTTGTNTFTTNTLSNGFYIEYAATGDYTVAVSGLPSYLDVTPVSQDVTFNDFGNTENLNFCITANQAVNDVNVRLIPTTQARPGFNTSYQLVYKNEGTTTISGDVTLEYNSGFQTFLNATPTEDAIASNKIIFNYSNLVPFETRIINLEFNTFPPPTVNGGDVLEFTASITPDITDFTPANNTYEFSQIVVNAYDPNDKQVLQGETITPEQTTEYLDYLIRFQNTGTASAVNVSVTDVLHSKLDWSTFQMVSASHDYAVNIINGNFVQFKLDDIYLPAQQDDEAGSNGFIAFKIKPKADVAEGDIMTGKSNIYFDFNEPIITNTVETQVVVTNLETLGVTNFQLYDSLVVYPNPSTNVFNFNVKNNIEINSVSVFNILGKQLLTINESINKIDLSSYNSGVYFLQIETNRGALNKRVIKN